MFYQMAQLLLRCEKTTEPQIVMEAIHKIRTVEILIT
jgi:hypothetical protein